MSYNSDTTRILAEGEMKEGNFDRALQLFQSIIEQDSNNPVIWFSMGACKLYKLATNPLQLYQGNKSIIEVAFQYFVKSISCIPDKVTITNPFSKEVGAVLNLNIHSIHSNHITIAEKNTLSVAFQVLEALRSLYSTESKNANQNFDTAKKYAMQAGATRMMGILNPQNNMYNNAFQANFAMQNENTAYNLHQQYQNNLQALEKINDIVQNLKDNCRYFISKLRGSFTEDDLSEFEWHLLSYSEREERIKLKKSQAFWAESLIIIDLQKEHPKYQNSKNEAESFFKNKKFHEAIEAAEAALNYYEEIKAGAIEKNGGLTGAHYDIIMTGLIRDSKEKIKKRTNTLIWLSVLLCIAVFICLFCI